MSTKKEKRNPFLVDTKGECFICFKKNSSSLTTFTVDRELYKYFGRYLSIDVRKLLKIPEATASSVALGKEEDVGVPLCKQCLNLSELFCELYGQFDLVRMRLTACVKSIHDLMVEAVKEPCCGLQIHVDKEEDELVLTNNLRKETIIKCAYRFKGAPPQVTVDKVKIKKKKLPLKKRKKLTKLIEKGKKILKKKKKKKKIKIVVKKNNATTDTDIIVISDGEDNTVGTTGNESSVPMNIPVNEDKGEEPASGSNQPASPSSTSSESESENFLTGGVKRPADTQLETGSEKRQRKQNLGDNVSHTYSNTRFEPVFLIVSQDPDIEAKESEINKNKKKFLPKLLTTISGIDYLCSHCNKKFPNEGSYLKHQKYITRLASKEKDKNCPYCPEKFLKNKYLTYHLLRHHRDTLYLKYKHPDLSQEDFLLGVTRIMNLYIVKAGEGDKRKKCLFCNKIYCQKPDAEMHLAQVHHDDLVKAIVESQNVDHEEDEEKEISDVSPDCPVTTTTTTVENVSPACPATTIENGPPACPATTIEPVLVKKEEGIEEDNDCQLKIVDICHIPTTAFESSQDHEKNENPLSNDPPQLRIVEACDSFIATENVQVQVKDEVGDNDFTDLLIVGM